MFICNCIVTTYVLDLNVEVVSIIMRWPKKSLQNGAFKILHSDVTRFLTTILLLFHSIKIEFVDNFLL